MKTAPIAKSLGVAVFTRMRRWLDEVNGVVQVFGIRAEHYCLLLTLRQMSEKQGIVMQSDLAAALNLDAMLISNYLRYLGVLGVVSRVAHPTDSRAKNIKLTKEGSQMLSAIQQDIGQIDVKVFGSKSKQNRIAILLKDGAVSE